MKIGVPVSAACELENGGSSGHSAYMLMLIVLIHDNATNIAYLPHWRAAKVFRVGKALLATTHMLTTQMKPAVVKPDIGTIVLSARSFLDCRSVPG
jgi:hypothetical protein